MNFQQGFKAYQNTPHLWHGYLNGLHSFKLPSTQVAFKPTATQKRLRLGKWVEQFAVHQIKIHESYKLLAESLQILRDKQTLGELDILFVKASQAIHLECVYKFYLYDHTRSYKKPLEYWIGPNRTDALVYKLDKLKTKQLPLLYHPTCESYLNHLGYSSSDFKQYLQFKAQLFLPLNQLHLDIYPLNKSCIQGFHCSIEALATFKDFQLYIPHKLDWLLKPHLNVEWLTFSEGYKSIEDQCQKHRSPLVWLKDPEQHLQKAFITWY